MFNRKHFFSFAILLLALVWQQHVAAQCTTQAGTFQPGTYSICSNESFILPYNNDATLDANDNQLFVLHDGTATVLGNIIFISETPAFPLFFSTPGTIQTYQIACVAGDAIFGNWIDFNDPCLSFTGGGTLTITGAPGAGIITPLLVECDGSLPVVLTANVVPLGVAYTYEWSGPVSLPAIKTPMTSTPGVYTVTVSNGQCSSTASATVYTAETAPIDLRHHNFVCEPTATQQLSAVPVYPVSSYLWSNGETSSSITIANGDPTSYCVTVTYNQGCTGSVCGSAIQYTPTITINHQNVGCTDSLNFLYVAGNLLTGSPVEYTWEYEGNTFNVWSIESPEPGNYSVTVSGAGGCSATATYFLEASPDECALLEGNVYADMNSSCSLDAGDTPMAGVVIAIRDANGNIVTYAYTNANGHWGTNVYAGDYTLSAAPPANVWNPCPLSVSVTAGQGATLAQDFFMQPSELCSDLWVDINNSLFRRCLPASYAVNYCNNGSLAAEDAYIEIMLDPLLTIDSAAIPYAPILGTVNMYRFDLGDVPVGFCGYFWIAVHVSCSAELGESICSKATAFPHAPCGPQNLWSGASLQITGECEADSIRFILKNVGTATMSQALNYLVIEDAIIMKSAPPPTIILAAGDELPINVPANGATWRVEADQEINHPGNSMPSLTIEGCTTGQTFSVGYMNQYPLDDADPWIDEDCSVAIFAYDPNFKEGFPLGYGDKQQIERSTDLEYVIHFQNTGNDTAFLVILRDTISPWLDPTTIRPGASSHPYKFDFYGSGSNIKFTFDNILLPDSSTNFAGSQGFVSYRIAQKPGVPFGSHVLNSAAIYFDFNEPVITNTTHHLVDTNYIQVAVSAWSPVVPNISLQVAPNPARDVATLQIKGLSEGTEARVEIIDQLGRVCQTGLTVNGLWSVRKGQLSSGMYHIRVTTNTGLLGTGKVIFE